MGCSTKVLLEDDLTFGICCHDPTTGVLTDADSAPLFRVYEDEDSVPIGGGHMAKLDDSGTTGFYVGSLSCTQRNGYQVARSYTIYIEATVNGSTGGICYGFTVKASPWIYSIVDGINTQDGRYYNIVGRIRTR